MSSRPVSPEFESPACLSGVEAASPVFEPCVAYKIAHGVDDLQPRHVPRVVGARLVAEAGEVGLRLGDREEVEQVLDRDVEREARGEQQALGGLLRRVVLAQHVRHLASGSGGNGQRAAGSGQRAAGSGQRAAGSGHSAHLRLDRVALLLLLFVLRVAVARHLTDAVQVEHANHLVLHLFVGWSKLVSKWVSIRCSAAQPAQASAQPVHKQRTGEARRQFERGATQAGR